MTQQISDNLLTKKHNQLLKYAKISGIFSWVVLIFSFIASWLKAMENYNFISIYCFSNTSIELAELLHEPLAASVLIGDIIGVFLKWLFFFIVLRFITLALRMIVETDVNYRLNKTGEIHNGQ